MLTIRVFCRRTGQRSPSPTDDRLLQSARSSQAPSRQPAHRGYDQYGHPQQPQPPYPPHVSNGYAQPPPPHHVKQRHDHPQHHREYPPMPHQPAYGPNGHAQPPMPHHLQGSHRSKPLGGTSSLLDVVADRSANPIPNHYGRQAYDEEDYDAMGRREISRAKETYTGQPRGGPGEGTAGEEGDGDTRTYCYCDRVSFGEMIGCDDDNCSREWVSFRLLCPDLATDESLCRPQFHLSCLDMAAPPRGEWFCDECRARREKGAKTAKKPNRNRARVPTATNGAINGHGGVPNGTSSRASVPPPSRSSNPRGV